MNSPRQSLGKWGEDQAAIYLSARGYSILERNLRTPYGEIDLLACQDSDSGPVIVAVEVKTRRSTSYGYPEQSISLKKREHLVNSIAAYMQEHPEQGESWRIDVISIQTGETHAEPSIVHFENALC